jgi:hypothetical protein
VSSPRLLVVGVAEADRRLADGVLGTAGTFAQAGYPYQQTRTLALAAVPPSAPK